MNRPNGTCFVCHEQYSPARTRVFFHCLHHVCSHCFPLYRQRFVGCGVCGHPLQDGNLHDPIVLVDDGADEGFAVAAGDVGDNVGGDGANQPDVIDLTGETDDDTDAGDDEVIDVHEEEG